MQCLERLDAVRCELGDEDAPRDRIVIDDEDAKTAAGVQHLDNTATFRVWEATFCGRGRGGAR